MAITTKQKEQILQLRADGLSYKKVAEKVGVAKQTAVNIAKDNIDEIATLRNIETEAFFEEKRINSRGRLEQLTTLHDRIRTEIESRDLSDVPTDKLVTLLLKTQDALKAEVYTPTIRSTEEQQADKLQRERLSW